MDWLLVPALHLSGSKTSKFTLALWGPASKYAQLCELVIPECTFLEGQEVERKDLEPVYRLGADGGQG